jgi:hypothetical protein
MVMLFFTIFSRAITNLTIPKITVSLPRLYINEWEIAFSDIQLTKIDNQVFITASIYGNDVNKLFIGMVCEYEIYEYGNIIYGDAIITEIIYDTTNEAALINALSKKLLNENVIMHSLIARLKNSAYQYVYPRNVMITPDTVYIIRKENSFFSENWYLEQRFVEIEDLENGLISIVNGINANELLVNE